MNGAFCVSAHRSHTADYTGCHDFADLQIYWINRGPQAPSPANENLCGTGTPVCASMFQSNSGRAALRAREHESLPPCHLSEPEEAERLKASRRIPRIFQP